MVDRDGFGMSFSLEPPKDRKCDYDSEFHNKTPFVIIRIDGEYIDLCINHLDNLANDLDYKGRFTSFVIDEFSITGSWEGYCNFCDDKAHTEFVMDDSRIKMCEDHVNYLYYDIYGFYRYVILWWEEQIDSYDTFIVGEIGNDTSIAISGRQYYGLGIEEACNFVRKLDDISNSTNITENNGSKCEFCEGYSDYEINERLNACIDCISKMRSEIRDFIENNKDLMVSTKLIE